MKLFIKRYFFSAAVLVCLQVAPHPTSYEDSVGVMGYHAPFMSHSQLSYSHRYWFATGLHHIKKKQANSSKAFFASANFLLKRWNGASYQGNLYAVGGLGQSDFSGRMKGSALSALQFDIEDRRLYFLAKHQAAFNRDEEEFSQSMIRLGFAPYVEGYDGIHSWLILEWQRVKFWEEKSITDLTPLIRLFYRNLLFELGHSFDGATRFNYITHF